MKKTISFILILFFTFSSITNITEKKANAFVIESYLLFQAGVSFMAFTGFASFIAVNGYHMQLSDLAVTFANKYYDYANGVYTEKANKINVLDKFNLFVSSAISGNDYLTLQELELIKNDVITEFPQLTDLSNITVDYDFQIVNVQNRFPYTYNGDSSLFEMVSNFYQIKEEYKGKTIKISHASYPEYYYFVEMNNYGWFTFSGNQYPTLKVIDAFGKNFYVQMKHPSFTYKPTNFGFSNFSTATKNYAFGFFSNTTSTNSYGLLGLKPLGYDTPNFDPYEVTKDSFSDGTQEFKKAFPNFYSALNGIASTVDELKDKINFDEYLQREITALLNKQVVNEENDLVTPAINPDGTIYYPGTQTNNPDIPDNPPYTPTETWYNNLFGWLVGAPDLIINGLTDLVNEKLLPGINTIRDTVLSIPEKLDLIWEWIIDFPDIIYGFFVPTLPAISETWQPVTDLFNQKIFPVIQPFQNIGFYEEELQDISADIKIGQYQGNHKIIDYSYLKSVREPIKSVIRSFFWILIIFFNLDQVHRLIRNQSIVKTYIRKVDEPGGNK